MRAPLLPTAEHALEVGVRRAAELVRMGGSVEDATRVLVVAGYAAELMQTDALALELEP